MAVLPCWQELIGRFDDAQTNNKILVLTEVLKCDLDPFALGPQYGTLCVYPHTLLKKTKMFIGIILSNIGALLGKQAFIFRLTFTDLGEWVLSSLHCRFNRVLHFVLFVAARGDYSCTVIWIVQLLRYLINSVQANKCKVAVELLNKNLKHGWEINQKHLFIMLK